MSINIELEAIVFDLLGKELIRENINGRFDISSLEKGTYILNLSDGVNTSTHKIIKEKQMKNNTITIYSSCLLWASEK